MAKKIILQLDDLTCPSCLTKIEHAVAHEAGVSQVKVLFNAGKVKAVFDETQNDVDHLVNVIVGLGYTVKNVKVGEL